ncbi:hypothetical protein PHLCEN_2v7609 [Hermanssonia centrifuga]|uniref:G domain-containing protein n=1 Tax=Hermanssonia centrifuga TaxID=98765 RepID=A0A2R6NW23_9APHY|nr:hypothetical protein PHLCEN_2v7609 [Hermanssonia centrifuga]
MQPELNVLVVGMPNVGKSTLLNALRAMGIPGPTPKALRTSAHPGLTRALSTRLKLSLAPLVYSYDSPGVMLPFLGKGDKGAERGVKLALIVDIYEFLDLLARRLGMLKRGGVVDQTRAAVWFIKWWRDNGGQLAASTPLTTSMPTDGPQTHRRGWGFDFEWSVDQSEVASYDEAMIQRKMETCIDAFEAEVQEEEQEGGGISSTQEKKRFKEKLQSKRVAKSAAKLAARKNHM